MFAFITGFLFQISPYVPMCLSIVICFVCFALSFLIQEAPINRKIEEMKKPRIEYQKNTKIIVVTIISYCLFFSAINLGQQNGKLFIQYELANSYEIALTASYLGIIVAASRISRIVTNVGFKKMYGRYQEKISVTLTALLVLSFAFMIIGYFIPNPIIKFIIMAIGFCLILGIRDPYRTYTESLVLKKSNTEQQQAIFIYLGMARKVGMIIFGLIISAVLTKLVLFYIILGLLALALIAFSIQFGIYKMIIEKVK